MFLSRRKYDALREELARLEAERDEGRQARRQLVTDLREAHESLKQITDHDGRLTALLQTTQRDQGAEVARLNRRLERALGACARYRAEAEAARRPRPKVPGGRELYLTRRAHRELAERLVELQAANDAMCRERVDEAGTLAVVRPAGREPGVAS
ncbi:hypothetical protein [Streptomyces sp. URMC 124]|uniref:hypothetical protein n=1 Tax=Streptomyces sp. URMC 124 TaxID=3423405 RepID=UPI003F1C8D3A